MPVSRLLFVLAMVLNLNACVSQGKNTVAIDSSMAQEAIVEPSPAQAALKLSDKALVPELPQLDLDAETLEHLLILNLASYQGDWALAAERAKKVAVSTNDYRLARLASLLALRNTDYDNGLDSAKVWYRLSPDDPDALNLLIITQLGSSDMDGVKLSLAKHAHGKTTDEHIKLVSGLLTRQTNRKAAIEAAAYMVELYDESAQAALSSAYVAEFFSDFKQSEVWLSKALTLQPGWELAAQMHAKLLASQGRLDERGIFIADYVAEYPESTLMQINFAAELVRKGESDKAYEFIQRLLEKTPLNTDVLQYAGALAEDRDDDKAAIRFYRRTLNIDPSKDSVRWSLARRYFINENYVSAERYFNDIRSPDMLFNAQMQVANSRYEFQGIDAALAVLSGLEPSTEAEYVSLALTRNYLLMAEYRYEEALGAINEALYFLPENKELIYARALVGAELKRLDIVEPDLRSIIQSEPEHANALNALGYTLADQTTRFSEAQELIERAHKLRPEDAHILDSMGWIAYRLQNYSLAIEYLEKAFAKSEEVEIATHLAEVLWESGEQQRATEIWLEWVAKEGDNRLLQETMRRYGISVDAATLNEKPVADVESPLNVTEKVTEKSGTMNQ